MNVFQRDRLSVTLLLFLWRNGAPTHCQEIKQPVAVPFHGCKADGQAGPLNAPTNNTKLVYVPVELASQLAWYQAEQGPGVLGPRGWHCFETYGSNGGSLYLSPTPLMASNLFSEKWHGFTGAVIQLSVSIGDTSGRFQVAEIIARVFPAHKKFVDDVIAEGMEPASSFPFGPYPADKLTYKSKEVVEYTTPPNTDGLGTRSRLIKDSEPIEGVAMLTGEELSLTQLSVRLPQTMRELTRAIIHEVEREGATKVSER